MVCIDIIINVNICVEWIWDFNSLVGIIRIIRVNLLVKIGGIWMIELVILIS